MFSVSATSHKEAFVERIHQEIIRISCTQLGLYVLAVHIWKRMSDLHFRRCLVSQSLRKCVLSLLLGQCVKHTECKSSLLLHYSTIIFKLVFNHSDSASCEFSKTQISNSIHEKISMWQDALSLFSSKFLPFTQNTSFLSSLEYEAWLTGAFLH